METRPHRLMFVAGENSGDLHGSRLIAELRTKQPEIECFGFGGDRMAAEGMRLDENLAQKLPIMGVTQVVRNYGQIRNLLQRAFAMLARERPDAIVLIDYPGFNLRVATEAKRLGIPVIYFISPQIWAWHQSRIEIIRKTVSLMLVILPFEETLYRDAGVRSRYVGHPLLDDAEEVPSRLEARAALSIPAEARVIGLIPGSREGEIVRHLPLMLQTATLLLKHFPNAHFLVPMASTISPDLITKYVGRYPGLPITISSQRPKTARAAMDFAICKSGTSTLELALADVPMVIIYHVSAVTYWIARAVVRIPWVGLVNIVANDSVAPELLQDAAQPEPLAKEVIRIMESPALLEAMHDGYARVRAKLGKSGASRRAAEAVLELLSAQ